MSRMLLTGAMVGSLTTATAMSLFGFGSKERAKPVSVTPKQKPEPVVPKPPCLDCRGPPRHPSSGCPEGRTRVRDIAYYSFVYNHMIFRGPPNNSLIDRYRQYLRNERKKVTGTITYELIVSAGEGSFGYMSEDHVIKSLGKYQIYENDTKDLCHTNQYDDDTPSD